MYTWQRYISYEMRQEHKQDLHNDNGVPPQVLEAFAQYVGRVLLGEKLFNRRRYEMAQWFDGIKDNAGSRWDRVRCNKGPAL